MFFLLRGGADRFLIYGVFVFLQDESSSNILVKGLRKCSIPQTEKFWKEICGFLRHAFAVRSDPLHLLRRCGIQEKDCLVPSFIDHPDTGITLRCIVYMRLSLQLVFIDPQVSFQEKRMQNADIQITKSFCTFQKERVLESLWFQPEQAGHSNIFSLETEDMIFLTTLKSSLVSRPIDSMRQPDAAPKDMQLLQAIGVAKDCPGNFLKKLVAL